MMPAVSPELRRGRVHYAWIVLAVMFSATLAGVGVRAAPGVMIVPLAAGFWLECRDDFRRGVAQHHPARAPPGHF